MNRLVSQCPEGIRKREIEDEDEMKDSVGFQKHLKRLTVLIHFTVTNSKK